MGLASFASQEPRDKEALGLAGFASLVLRGDEAAAVGLWRFAGASRCGSGRVSIALIALRAG